MVIWPHLWVNKAAQMGGVAPIMFNTRRSADVKPDADVDDWEAIATDEEKGEFPYAASKSQKHRYEFITCINIQVLFSKQLPVCVRFEKSSH